MPGLLSNHKKASMRLSFKGQPFDLHNTLFSGQNFRWRKIGERYTGVVFGNVVDVQLDGDGLEFTSYPDLDSIMGPLLRDYFSLDFDIDAVYDSISKDNHIRVAIERYRGMRILRQDPWETVVSFLCAQASNVPRITKNVEDMCESFGSEIGLGRHNYPTPEQLASAGENALREIGLGYRAKFLVDTARCVADSEIQLTQLRTASYDDALASLLMLNGVGDKVANCILLFALDKPSAFPVDTWIQKMLQQWYLGQRKTGLKQMRMWAQDYFGQHAGYANQYIFHSSRIENKRSI